MWVLLIKDCLFEDGQQDAVGTESAHWQMVGIGSSSLAAAGLKSGLQRRLVTNKPSLVATGKCYSATECHVSVL